MQSTAAVLNEIGVGGLSVEVATDNQAALKSLVERGLAASSAQGCHWRNISDFFFRPTPLWLSPGRHTMYVLMNELDNA